MNDKDIPNEGKKGWTLSIASDQTQQNKSNISVSISQYSSDLVVLSEGDEARSLYFLSSSLVSLWLCVSDTESWSTPAEQNRNTYIRSHSKLQNVMLHHEFLALVTLTEK